MKPVESLLWLVEEIYAASRGEAGWGDVAVSLAAQLAASALGVRREDPENRIERGFVGRGLDEAEHERLLRDSRRASADEPFADLSGLRRLVVVGAAELPFGEGLVPACWLRVPSEEGSPGIELVALRRSGAPRFAEELGLLRALAPHLLRASEIERERARFQDMIRCMEVTASQSTSAALVIDGDLRVLARNAAADRALKSGLGMTLEFDRLVPRHEMLARVIGRALACPAREAIVERAPAGRSDAVLHFVLAQPIDRAGPSVTPANQRILIVASADDAASAVDPDVMTALFGLTRAELRLAERIVAGRQLASIAEELGISLETARTYLKLIFRKTGTARQAELVRLLLLTPRACEAR